MYVGCMFINSSPPGTVNRVIIGSDDGLSPIRIYKPVSESMVGYWQFQLKEQISVKFKSKLKKHSRKYMKILSAKWRPICPCGDDLKTPGDLLLNQVQKSSHAFLTFLLQIVIRNLTNDPTTWWSISDCTSTIIETFMNVVDRHPNSLSDLFRNQNDKLFGMSIRAIWMRASNNLAVYHPLLWRYEMTYRFQHKKPWNMFYKSNPS